jgi:hypothetical protein
MHFFKVLLLMILISMSTEALCLNVSLGAHKSNRNAQDRAGEEDSNSLSPTVSVGHLIKYKWINFAPQLGFTKNKRESADEYGGDYSISTIYLLYDFLWSPLGLSVTDRTPLALRFGLGNFIKSIKGDGGTVSVPNGASGTIDAYQPGESDKSYTGSLNLGFDFNGSLLSSNWSNYGGQFELFIFSALKSEKRSTAFNLLLTYIF